MSNTIRLRRRIKGGSNAAGAPATLKTTEPAYNEVDDVLYLGYGDDGSGNATSVIAVAGRGAFVDTNSTQSVPGAKTFTVSPIVPTATAGDSSQKAASTAFVAAAITAGSVQNGDKGDIIVTNSGGTWTIKNNIVDNARLAQMATKTYKGRTSTGTGNAEDIPLATLQSDLGLPLKANLNSPTFTGVVTVPNVSSGDNSGTAANTAFVNKAINDAFSAQDYQTIKGGYDASANPNYPAANAGDTYRITAAGKIGGAAGAVVEIGDTLICFVDNTPAGTQSAVGANWIILQTNIDGATTATNTQTLTNKSMSGTANTFSNIPNTAITGLGTMSTQNANAVAITGGSVSNVLLDNVIIDGGSF